MTTPTTPAGFVPVPARQVVLGDVVSVGGVTGRVAERGEFRRLVWAASPGGPRTLERAHEAVALVVHRGPGLETVFVRGDDVVAITPRTGRTA